MAARLLPCPSCQRHVRIHERSCPFCADSIPERVAPPIPTSAQTSRLGRGARIALGAAFAAALPACGGASPEPQAPGPGPAPTSTAAPDPGGPDDDGAPVAEYGAPAPPDDDGSNVAEYGAPAPPDEGGMAPKYGGPPHFE